MLAGLMSRWTRPRAWASSQRFTYLPQNVDRSRDRQRTVLADHLLQRHSLQQLHDEVQGLVVRDAEIVELHRVRRSQAGRGLRLPPESLDGKLRGLTVVRADRVAPDQLDGRRPRQHPVGCLVDLAHAPTSQHLAQAIAPHLPLSGNLLPQSREDAGNHHGHAEHQIVGVVHEERAGDRIELERAGGSRDQHADRIHGRRKESRQQHLPRRNRNDGRDHQNHRARPGDHRARVEDVKRDRHHVHHEPDRKRHRHQVYEGEIGDEERIGIAAAEIEEEREGDRDAAGGNDVGLAESGPPRVGDSG